MLTIVPKCDVCKTSKQFTNSWFVVFFRKTVKDLGCSRFAVYDYTLRIAKQKGAHHICGEQCLTALTSRNLANRTGKRRAAQARKVDEDEGLIVA